MTEYRTVTFAQPATTIFPTELGGVTSATVDFVGSDPQLAAHMDGWEVINSQVILSGDTAYLIFTLKTSLDTSHLLGRPSS